MIDVVKGYGPCKGSTVAKACWESERAASRTPSLDAWCNALKDWFRTFEG